MPKLLTAVETVDRNLHAHWPPEERKRIEAQAEVERNIDRKIAEEQGGDTKTSNPSRYGPGAEPEDGAQPSWKTGGRKVS